MAQQIIYSQSFQIRGGDFINAGTVSVQIKKILKELGLKPEVIYKVAICCYEAEMNVIMYSYRGNVDFSITPDEVIVIISDEGPGIKNIELAMKEGFSTDLERVWVCRT
jgi:anti-sigma regulatory factor (Ser/Thr protein kinase)